MTDYCQTSDLYDFGVPRGAIPNPGRLIASVSAGSDALTLDAHGFAEGQPVSFRAEAGGSLPSPLAEGTTYYVCAPSSEYAFQVALTDGGPAIDLTTAGSRVLVLESLPIAAAIEWASRIIDDMLPAHVVPLELPVSPIVRMTCAELAAWKLTNRQGSGAKSLTDMVDAANKRIERWADGIPLRGDNTPPAAGLSARATASRTDARGWGNSNGSGYL